MTLQRTADRVIVAKPRRLVGLAKDTTLSLLAAFNQSATVMWLGDTRPHKSSAELQLEDHKRLSGLPRVDPKRLTNCDAAQVRES